MVHILNVCSLEKGTLSPKYHLVNVGRKPINKEMRSNRVKLVQIEEIIDKSTIHMWPN